MRSANRILLLRISFWLGVVIDGFVAVQLLLPNFWASFDGLKPYAPSTTLNFGLGIASALMFGWTFLLIWADRKPLERKGVLLLTVVPVILGLAMNNVFAATSGLRSLQTVLPELALQTGLAALFTFSYINARQATK
ncbi:MAG: hypothetical protein ACLQO7_05780 [Candidatus Bathyarchaeia archaeon]